MQTFVRMAELSSFSRAADLLHIPKASASAPAALETMFERGPKALRGRLRVDLPGAVARDLVIPRLPEFLRAHPQVERELSSTDRRVDLVREGFDDLDAEAHRPHEVDHAL